MMLGHMAQKQNIKTGRLGGWKLLKFCTNMNVMTTNELKFDISAIRIIFAYSVQRYKRNKLYAKKTKFVRRLKNCNEKFKYLVFLVFGLFTFLLFILHKIHFTYSQNMAH
jgi:hypothetical protein